MSTASSSFRECSILSESDLSNNLIQKVCGILDVNTFEVRPPYQESPVIQNPEVECLRGGMHHNLKFLLIMIIWFIGLYIHAALMAHDCTGNTFLAVDDDFTLTVKASQNIKKNTTIYFNYANSLAVSMVVNW